MRSLLLGAITGAVGFAALVSSTSQLADNLSTCGNPTTVYVTVPGVATVTIHDLSISAAQDIATGTVYLEPSSATVQVSELSNFPTTTLTRVATSTHTLTKTAKVPAASGDNGVDTTTIEYETTVTQTRVVETVYITQSSLASPAPLSFVVVSGSTSWFGAVAPPSTQSYVVVTSAVIVQPVHTRTDILHHTRTTTRYTTIGFISSTTIYEVLPASTSVIDSSPALGTATPLSVSSGGWNASAGFAFGASYTRPVTGQPSFITEQSSFDIYQTRSSVLLTVSAAKGGFAIPSSDLAADGSYTTTDAGESASHTKTAKASANKPTSMPWKSSNTTKSSSVESVSASVTKSNSNVTKVFMTSTAAGVATTLTWPSSFYNGSSIIPSLTTSAKSLKLTASASGYVKSTAASSVYLVPTQSGSSQNHSAATNSTIKLQASAVSTTAGIFTSLAPSSFLTVYSSSSSGHNLSALTTLRTSTTDGFLFSTFTGFISATSKPAKVNSSNLASSTSSGRFSVTSVANSSASTSMAVSTLGYNTSSWIPSALIATSSIQTSSVQNSVYGNSSSTPVKTSTFSSAILSSYTPTSTSILALTSTLTSNSTSPSSTPTSCGEVGDFTLSFDDIPPLVATNTTFNTVSPQPVFNPYHQFDFSDGFVVVPPPTDPYLPSSAPLLTEFIPNFNLNGSNSMSGPNTKEFGYSGDVGNGDHGLTGCFGFNFYGASFGCDSRGPDCKFTFTGFRYSRLTRLTSQVSQDHSIVPACPALNKCPLTPIKFTSEFSDLDSIRINVTVAGQPKIWWMDDLKLGWFNNTCAAGLCRVSAHIH